MPSKFIRNLPIVDPASGTETYIPVGTATGGDGGPVLCVIGGVHGTEYAAQDAVVKFWERLDPQRLNGEVRVVLAADVTAMVAHSAYVNPIDGKNLNRVWPGDPDGSLTERIASAITTNCVEGSDAVIDVHGGEWDEDIDCFIIAHRVGDPDLDKRTVDLAMALGFTYVEVTDAHGDVLGRGTGAAEAMKGGRPAMTLEAGGVGRREHRFVMAHVHALENAMRYLGITDGSPILFDGAPVLLDHGVLIKTTAEGRYVPAVEVGDWIEAGELFAEVVDYEGNVLEEIRAPEAGTVLDVIVARMIKAGGFGGKIGVL
jgi:predicted deacylase